MDTHQADNAEPLDEKSPLNYSFWAGSLILRGTTFPRVIFEVLKFGLIAEAIMLLGAFFEYQWDVSLAIPQAPFSAAGAVLGLLLVLRVNAGYDRWWEARKLWGGIVNQSRNLGIDGLAYGPADAEWRSKFLVWVAAFPHVVRRSLREERDMPEVSQLIGHDNALAISKSKHMPTVMARKLADMLHEARQAGMSRYAFLQSEQQRSQLIDYLGGCERIRNTPLAQASAILVRQFILLFLITLPFALLSDFNDAHIMSRVFGVDVDDSVLFGPLFIMLLSFFLLSLDRIGMELQNPFDTRRVDHLPLDAICHTIETNLLEILKSDPVVAQEGLVLKTMEVSPEIAAQIAKSNRGKDTMIS